MSPAHSVYRSVRIMRVSITVSLPVDPGNPQRIGGADAVWQLDDQEDDRGDENEDRQRHDLHIGPGHRLHSTEHRVDDRRDENQPAWSW